ncbi:Sulfate/thiosulfate import ATP-binding protein CysA 2 [Desulfamplus magnetovallimortis]|uniref:Sulfate/thiosulfate import ATP-binding protein CysA 2 n=1 Tax=Desulfamplus magnetovallimortis TaxID=1246637 RepID=A0A1W1HKC4_9BACT|nr:putative 2-aminoethylphosphonate ABC transporter ATP-binding protein [Desulfamplus magnetovallimortis]SLM32919.1 Sulfate/thiosulfate import ATP-binding protein CysA 2 [Desulfamplus magnetovallimortis]
MTQHGEISDYLSVHQLTKKFGKFTALDDISFSTKLGEFLCVLGPSGCGKTTVLRAIAGLEKPTSGTIVVEGRDVTQLPVSRRNVGIVFQSYALFPNLTAEDNIAYGLKQRSKKAKGVEGRVTELLETVGLSGMGNKYPAQLSGGQQQRVALARAMAISPHLLLLDEPLSALDAKVRIRLRSEIRQLQKRLGVTTIMVTHDQEEALTMADRILIIDRGKLVQMGTPGEVYDKPATPFVASFIGSMNFITKVRKMEDGIFGVGEHRLKISNGRGARRVQNGEPVMIGVRPEDVMIQADGGDGINTLNTLVSAIEYRGSLFRLSLNLPISGNDYTTIDADVPSEKVRRLGLQENMHLPIHLPVDRIRVYAA